MGGELPSLAKEGCLRASRFPELRADGVVGSMSRKPPLGFREALLIREVRWRENLFGGFATLNQPPRPRPLRRLRDIFLMGAATPPWPRRGIRSAPVSRVSHRQLAEEGSLRKFFTAIHASDTFSSVRI